MPRTSVASQALVGPYPAGSLAADAMELTFTAGDVANGNEVPWVGNRMLCLFWNTSADTDYYVTIGSVADSLGRSQDVTQHDIDFGAVGRFMVAREGWQQSDNVLHLDFENAAIEFAVIRID